MGVSPEPPCYFFMGSSQALPRQLKSNGLNLTSCGNNPSSGGSVCWLMKYSYHEKQKIDTGNTLLKLNLSTLSNGLYFLRVKTATGEFAVKRFAK